MKKLVLSLIVGAAAWIPGATVHGQSTFEAADRAFEMAAKYSARGYYVTPSKEGKAGFATTLEFTLPVSAGLDYVFILAGDKYCLDVDVWIESEVGNTIVKDTRKVDNGLCGVAWRSDYNGTATVVVHFARVSSRTGWAALVGRRGTPMNAVPMDAATLPTTTRPSTDPRSPSADSAIGK